MIKNIILQVKILSVEVWLCTRNFKIISYNDKFVLYGVLFVNHFILYYKYLYINGVCVNRIIR